MVFEGMLLFRMIFNSVIEFSEALALLPVIGMIFAIGGPVPLNIEQLEGIGILKEVK